MTSEFDAQNGPDKIPDDVESRLLDDDRRRDGEFLRDYLARHRVDITEHSDE